METMLKKPVIHIQGIDKNPVRLLLRLEKVLSESGWPARLIDAVMDEGRIVEAAKYPTYCVPNHLIAHANATVEKYATVTW